MSNNKSDENEMPEADQWLHNFRTQARHWINKETHLPNHINGFDSTFQIREHALIPSSLRDFIMESFPNKDKLDQINIDDINQVLNDVWEGPNSMKKVVLETGKKKYFKITGKWVENFDDIEENVNERH